MFFALFNNNVIDLKKFNKLNPYIKKRLIEQILKEILQKARHQYAKNRRCDRKSK